MEIHNFCNSREFERSLLRAHRIVAVAEMNGYLVAVCSHAMQMFAERGNLDPKPKKLKPNQRKPVLERMISLLKNSDYAKRRLSVYRVRKHGGQKVCYRSAEGWIFVLVWNFEIGGWLLKTVYRLETAQKREYKIHSFLPPEQVKSWNPNTMVIKGQIDAPDYI